MMQIIPQTDKEKLKMYMKLSKTELAKMLIQTNKIIEARPQKGVFDTTPIECNAVGQTPDHIAKAGYTSPETSTSAKKEGDYSDNYRSYYVDRQGNKHF